MNFIFFTKTNWNEPPRLRHQLASLLCLNGNNVIFGQRPQLLKSNRRLTERDGITFFRSSYLLHHQLRINSFLSKINAHYEMASIEKLTSGIYTNHVIINFNYDYYFLRSMFPNSKIVTIINDDFIAQAKFNGGKHTKKALEKTCLMSDSVLAASLPLVESISQIRSCELFLPWAVSNYRQPKMSRNNIRDTCLIWGFIDFRIDFEFILTCALENPDLIFRIVGPVAKEARNEVMRISTAAMNITVEPPSTLEDLSLDNVLVGFIPYRCNTEFGNSVTMLNKGFQILSMGLPLIIRGMPNFMKEACIFSISSELDFKTSIEECRDKFSDMQPGIRLTLKNHDSKSRYNQLQKVLF